jgi:hypothetical protein
VLWPDFGIILAGSFGVIALLAVLGLLVPRLLAVRQMAVAGLATLGVCLALDALLGPAGGRPPIPALHGIDASYPVTQLAVALAVALTGLPFLSRPMHRIVGTAIALAALAALVGGYGLPLNVASAIALGWGMAAACHLAFGSPAGLPSAAEVTDAVRDLRVDVHALAPMADQPWGVEAFAGQDEQGRPLELAVYGRDAADAQWLNKVWRFCVYRDSGPTLMIHRHLPGRRPARGRRASEPGHDHRGADAGLGGRAAAPVPGGAGVVEAGLIAGLTSAGVPQSQAVAAVFIERLWTAYLPPIWGWLTLVWMRYREYV